MNAGDTAAVASHLISGGGARRARYGELPLQETDKLGGRLEQLLDASGHRQTLAGTLGLGALCGAEERRIRRRGRERVSAPRSAHAAAFESSVAAW